MKIVVFGNKNTTRLLLESLIEKKYCIKYLVILDSAKINSFKISGSDSNLETFANRNNINIYNPGSYKLDKKIDYDFFKQQSFDIGFCTGWQRLIPEDILNTFKLGVFGWHGSGFEFPNGRGRSPINWSIRLGLNKVYHNCFKYESGIDDGKVFETKEILIKDNEYISDIINKASIHIKQSAIRLIETCKNKKLNLIPQTDHSYISFPKLTEDDGELNHSMSRTLAKNIVRSCSRPFPGAYLISQNNQKIKIWKLDFYFDNKKNNFSEILFKDNLLIIRFRDGLCYSEDFEIIN